MHPALGTLIETVSIAIFIFSGWSIIWQLLFGSFEGGVGVGCQVKPKVF